MIYKDDDSCYDVEFEPFDRSEQCLNCLNDWESHDGWKCGGVPSHFAPNGSRSTNFRDYGSDEKYLTKSMRDSIIVMNTGKWFNTNPWVVTNGKPAHQTTKPTIDQWQAWAHNHPGDCACGIKRETCDYHK